VGDDHTRLSATEFKPSHVATTPEVNKPVRSGSWDDETEN
jgi:hypothetical protein